MNTLKRKFTLIKEGQSMLLRLMKTFSLCGQLSFAKHLEIDLIITVNKTAIAAKL